MNDYKDKLSGLAERLKMENRPIPIQEIRPVKEQKIKMEIIRATIHLPASLHQKVKIHCAKQKISFKNFVTELIKNNV